jgi:hypothetical protein
LRLLFWDIEMRPMEAYIWTPWPDSVPDIMVKKTQRVMSWAARWHDQKRVNYMDERDGYRPMLDGVWDLLNEADAVVSWNGKRFDSGHIRRAFAMEGMTPPSPFREIDLMQTVKSQMRFSRNTLDHVAKELGVGEKVQHNGFQLWIDCMAIPDFDPLTATWEEIVAAREAVEEARVKAWALMKKYNIQDVNLLVDLYDKLRAWVPNHPNVSLINGTFTGCTVCGSTEVQKRGLSYTNAGVFQRYRCNTCGHWDKDPKRLATVQLRSA